MTGPGTSSNATPTGSGLATARRHRRHRPRSRRSAGEGSAPCSTSAHLRTALADALTGDGTLADPAWREAAGAVPRELFLGSYFTQLPASVPTRYLPVHQSDDGWLEGIYSDQTLVTQLDGRVRPGDVTGGAASRAIPHPRRPCPRSYCACGNNSKSSRARGCWRSAPGPVTRPLGAHRLGDDRVTSVEYDPSQSGGPPPPPSRRPGTRAPGRRGRSAGDPDASASAYDRLIATCSVRYVPMAWLHQVKPGGRSWSPSPAGATPPGWRSSP